MPSLQIQPQPTGTKPWALVSASARRLGAAFSLALHQQGFAVGLHYHESASDCRKLCDHIRNDGGTADIIRADFNDSDDVTSLVNFFADKSWRVTIHNACLFEPDTPDRFDPNLFDAMMRINVKAAQTISQAMHQQNMACKTPSTENIIVYLLDSTLRDPEPNFYSYTVSKAALQAMLHMQCQTFAPFTRVNAIAPGLTLPSRWLDNGRFLKRHNETLLKRGPQTEDIVKAMNFLIHSPAITGETLTVDGGGSRIISDKSSSCTLTVTAPSC